MKHSLGCPQPDESQPEDSPTPESPGLLPPRTGDTSNLILYIVIAGATVIGLVLLALSRRCKDSEEK